MRYLVSCDSSSGYLIVDADNIYSAAKALYDRLDIDDSGITFYVSEQTASLKDGVYLPGYDSSDDLETLLNQRAKSWSKNRLWCDATKIVI